MSETAQLLERFRRAPELIALVLTGLGPEEQDWKAGEGKWSVRQIAAHLADSELVAAHRFRQVLAEDNPALIGYDQDAWAARLDYARRKPAASLESFRRIRTENYELLRDAPQEAFSRAGNHSERGRLTLHELLEGYARHAEAHAKQIQEIRDLFARQRAGRAGS